MATFTTVPQGHVDWFKLRIGKVTASEVSNLLTPDFKPRSGQTPRTYLYTKVGEVWRGQPQIHVGSWATEQGNIRQDEAIPSLAIDQGWKINEGGFVTSDDKLSGCSPDGLVEGQEIGVEVKCPEPTNHVRYLIEGVLPADYVAQVHASLYVTGYPQWVFYSYHRDFPAFMLVVKRDEEICEKIHTAVVAFHEQLSNAIDRITEVSK